MLKLIDDNKKEVIFNENYIMAVHKYKVVKGEGMALKVILTGPSFLGLWYDSETGVEAVFGLIERAMSRVKK